MSTLSESEARALRRCFGQFGTGVTVVTSQSGNERVGVTANSFSSLSLDPPLILWSIKRTSRSFKAFCNAEHFAINVLSADQISISQAFSGPELDKFSGIDWAPGATGAPIIRNAIAMMECRAENRYEGGDHVILIGRVLHFSQAAGDALLFSQGRYAVAIDHPKLAPIELEREHKYDFDEAEPSFWTLLFHAQHRMSRRFERHREKEGLNADQTRVLIDIFDKPQCTLDQLIKKSFLPRIVAEDAVAALTERGYVVRTSDDRLQLSEQGIIRRKAIGARWEAFEREELAMLDGEDVESARRVLKAILVG